MTKAIELGDGGSAIDWLFLAMAHWQLGQQEDARRWYEKAAQWINDNKCKDAEFLRFRAEAAALLGIELPEPVKQEPEAK